MLSRFERNSRAALVIAMLACMCLAGCAAMNRRPESLLPDHHVLRTGPFRIRTHKPLKASDPLVAELDSLSRQVGRAIGVAKYEGPDAVDVYLLKDEPSFRHYLKFFHPELPPRRAYFLATGNSRTIYTFVGDHLMEDLRHEATHALVNLSYPALPLWIDEGLAEVFEHPDRSSTPDPHIERFLADVKTGFVPDLARLEKITDVREMTPRDYRESWAWVRWGLAGPEPIRTSFTQYVRASAAGTAQSGAAPSLAQRWNEVAPRLTPQGAPMVAWLTNEAGTRRTEVAAAPVDAALRQARLQNDDTPAESHSTENPARTFETGSVPRGAKGGRPGFFRRLFGF